MIIICVERWFHLVCRDEVDEDGIQQLLCDSISFHYYGAHQVHHVHLHLLVVAVAIVTTESEKRIVKNYSEDNLFLKYFEMNRYFGLETPAQFNMVLT